MIQCLIATDQTVVEIGVNTEWEIIVGHGEPFSSVAGLLNQVCALIHSFAMLKEGLTSWFSGLLAVPLRTHLPIQKAQAVEERKHSKLYRYIEQLHDNRPWGAFLDAGTGTNSISWVADLVTERWTAVTGSAGEASLAQAAAGSKQRPQDQIVLGNWADAGLLKGEVYDTVLADYLLGAVEGYQPYFQPYLFRRLRPLTRRALYATGLEPYVPTPRPESPAGRLVWEIGRFRDACVLLKGGVPYREYPAPWVVHQIQSAGFAVQSVKHFSIGYKEVFVNAQIDIAIRRLDVLTDRSLAQALMERGEALRGEAHAMIKEEGALRSCRNYVIAATPA
ncbi:MAG: class I SAM-dependent methyltransferase [Pseudomonadota bacterium]